MGTQTITKKTPASPKSQPKGARVPTGTGVSTCTSIAVDIGNSRIATGMFVDDACRKICYNATSKAARVADKLIGLSGRASIALCSVVPKARQTIVNALAGKSASILEVSTAGPHPLKDVYPEMGADRLADAVAAWKFYGAGSPCAVLAYGTATTLTAVSPDARFHGGLISLGLGSILSVLHKETALLPEVSINDDETAVIELALDTPRAIVNGAILTQLGLTASWIQLVKNKLGTDTKIIATGGWSKTISRYTDAFDYIDPLLTLKGINFLARYFLKTADPA